MAAGSPAVATVPLGQPGLCSHHRSQGQRRRGSRGSHPKGPCVHHRKRSTPFRCRRYLREVADAALLVISGPPGAGKSTVAEILAGAGAGLSGAGPTVLVQGDRFFDFLASGFIEPWLPESADQNAVVIEATAAATSGVGRR